jgi:hypothetical protein
MGNITCPKCGGPAQTHAWKGWQCSSCDQVNLLKEQNKIQKESLKIQREMSGIPAPKGPLASIFGMVFGLISWMINEAKAKYHWYKFEATPKQKKWVHIEVGAGLIIVVVLKVTDLICGGCTGAWK